MATSKSQRVVITIILVALVVGTFGSFAAMILAQDNDSKLAAESQKESAEFEAAYKDYQKKVELQNAELTSKYYEQFSQYAARVGEFDLEQNNKELKTEDLVVGDGEVVADDTKFAAYYILWLPSGKLEQQSINNDKKQLDTPIMVSNGLGSASLIEGWKEGMKGMKIGGVRELTVPSDKAYAETGKGDIPPNTPLKFIVMAIPLPEQIPQPNYPASMMQGLY